MAVLPQGLSSGFEGSISAQQQVDVMSQQTSETRKVGQVTSNPSSKGDLNAQQQNLTFGRANKHPKVTAEQPLGYQSSSFDRYESHS